MAVNPIPSRITPQMWQLWEAIDDVVPTAVLGGIYANKRGYHNTVNANLAQWPNDYSIQHPQDLRGPRDKARGLDVGLSATEMRRRTDYLRRAALHPEDTRLRALREFIGTLNGVDVYCLIRDSTGTWRSDAGRDKSHLTHIHKSVYTAYVDDWAALEPIVSVYAGVTWEEWQNDMTPAELLNFMRTTRLGWGSDAMRKRQVALGWPVEGLTTVQALTYTFEATNNNSKAIGAITPKLDEILAAALDDGNTNVILDAASLAALNEIKVAVAAVPELTADEMREIFADAGTE